MRLKCLAVVVAALVIPSAAQAATPVTSLSGDFLASNSTVTLTPNGVHFGTYADGGAIGGTMIYHGFDGHLLSELTDYSYTFNYRQSGITTGAAPYARVFLDDGMGAVDDVILDPSFCATVTPAQSTDTTLQMVGNSVRYDDDGCDGVAPDQQPWDDVVAAHGDQVIVGLLVSQGFSTGADVSAMLRQITVNGTTFVFGAPQAGPQGSAGSAGSAGGTGVAGVAGVTTIRTVIAKQKLTGDSLRVIHAPRHGRERFVKVRATLRGRALRVRRNSITVDLRGRPVGNYNVHLATTFRKANGRTHVVRSTRNLSVTPV